MSTCGKIGCTKPATHSVRFLIPVWGFSTEPKNCTEFFVGIEFCIEHATSEAAAAGPKTFPQESRDRISEVFRTLKKAPPDFSRLWGEIIPMSHASYQNYLRLTKK